MVGIIPKVFGFLGFVISANLKNANPKISSFTFRLFPRCHGQWLNSNLELRDELTLGTETMVLVRRPLVRHNIQAFDQAHARARPFRLSPRARAPLYTYSANGMSPFRCVPRPSSCRRLKGRVLVLLFVSVVSASVCQWLGSRRHNSWQWEDTSCVALFVCRQKTAKVTHLGALLFLFCQP